VLGEVDDEMLSQRDDGGVDEPPAVERKASGSGSGSP
jgi:hypothetical protein